MALVRLSPSGPAALPLSLSPGEVLGRPLDGGPGFVGTLDGPALGSLQRNTGYFASAVAGTVNNLAVPAQTAVLDLTPTGTVTLTGIALGALNDGGKLLVRQRGSAGRIVFPAENAGSSALNRFVTAFTLFGDLDTVWLSRFGSRWGLSDVSLSPARLGPSSASLPAPVFGLRPANIVGGGASPSDVTLTAALPFAVLVTGTVWYCTSAQVGQTLQLFSGPGGTGTAITDAMNAGAVAVRRSSVGAPVTLPAGSPIFARRSGGNVVGTVIVFCQRASA